MEILLLNEVRQLPRYVQALPTQFVQTGKNEGMRTADNDLPVVPKARLVVLGNLERDANSRRDAPTGSLLAQHMALAWAASGEQAPGFPGSKLGGLFQRWLDSGNPGVRIGG